MFRLGAALLLASLCAGLTGCGAQMRAAPDARPDYLRYVAFEAPGSEHVLLRWRKAQMPLRIYLPMPPDGLFDDPAALRDAAREGILTWKDAAAPGLPAFELVEAASEADVPIAWGETSPNYAIAHCFYDINAFQRRFGVAQIVVTGHFRDGRQAEPALVREVVTHEMGHALGMGGHSPNPEDLMYGFLDTGTGAADSEKTGRRLTARDRETLRLLYGRPIGARVSNARQAY